MLLCSCGAPKEPDSDGLKKHLEFEDAFSGLEIESLELMSRETEINLFEVKFNGEVELTNSLVQEVAEDELYSFEKKLSDIDSSKSNFDQIGQTEIAEKIDKFKNNLKSIKNVEFGELVVYQEVLEAGAKISFKGKATAEKFGDKFTYELKELEIKLPTGIVYKESETSVLKGERSYNKYFDVLKDSIEELENTKKSAESRVEKIFNEEKSKLISYFQQENAFKAKLIKNSDLSHTEALVQVTQMDKDSGVFELIIRDLKSNNMGVLNSIIKAPGSNPNDLSVEAVLKHYGEYSTFYKGSTKYSAPLNEISKDSITFSSQEQKLILTPLFGVEKSKLIATVDQLHKDWQIKREAEIALAKEQAKIKALESARKRQFLAERMQPGNKFLGELINLNTHKTRKVFFIINQNMHDGKIMEFTLQDYEVDTLNRTLKGEISRKDENSYSLYAYQTEKEEYKYKYEVKEKFDEIYLNDDKKFEFSFDGEFLVGKVMRYNYYELKLKHIEGTVYDNWKQFIKAREDSFLALIDSGKIYKATLRANKIEGFDENSIDLGLRFIERDINYFKAELYLLHNPSIKRYYKGFIIKDLLQMATNEYQIQMESIGDGTHGYRDSYGREDHHHSILGDRNNVKVYLNVSNGALNGIIDDIYYSNKGNISFNPINGMITTVKETNNSFSADSNGLVTNSTQSSNVPNYESAAYAVKYLQPKVSNEELNSEQLKETPSAIGAYYKKDETFYPLHKNVTGKVKDADVMTTVTRGLSAFGSLLGALDKDRPKTSSTSPLTPPDKRKLVLDIPANPLVINESIPSLYINDKYKIFYMCPLVINKDKLEAELSLVKEANEHFRKGGLYYPTELIDVKIGVSGDLKIITPSYGLKQGWYLLNQDDVEGLSDAYGYTIYIE